MVIAREVTRRLIGSAGHHLCCRIGAKQDIEAQWISYSIPAPLTGYRRPRKRMPDTEADRVIPLILRESKTGISQANGVRACTPVPTSGSGSYIGLNARLRADDHPRAEASHGECSRPGGIGGHGADCVSVCSLLNDVRRPLDLPSSALVRGENFASPCTADS